MIHLLYVSLDFTQHSTDQCETILRYSPLHKFQDFCADTCINEKNPQPHKMFCAIGFSKIDYLFLKKLDHKIRNHDFTHYFRFFSPWRQQSGLSHMVTSSKTSYAMICSLLLVTPFTPATPCLH